jgi:hypothetical protein
VTSRSVCGEGRFGGVVSKIVFVKKRNGCTVREVYDVRDGRRQCSVRVFTQST